MSLQEFRQIKILLSTLLKPSSLFPAALLLLTLIPNQTLRAEDRVWTSKDGQKTFTGKILDYAYPTVKVKFKNRKVGTFNVNILSELDKEYCIAFHNAITHSISELHYKVIQNSNNGMRVRDEDSGRTIFIRGRYDDSNVGKSFYYEKLFWSGSIDYAPHQEFRRIAYCYEKSLASAINSLNSSRRDLVVSPKSIINPYAGLKHDPNEYRLRNGAYLGRLTNNLSTLSIRNGNDSDAHVKLVSGGNTKLQIYLRSSNQVSLSGIPDGDYDIYFATGFGWNLKTEKFTRGQRFQKLNSKTNFSSSSTSSTRVSITLHKVIGGNAGTTGVSKEEFEKL